jgi:hypothetical protein
MKSGDSVNETYQTLKREEGGRRNENIMEE